MLTVTFGKDSRKRLSFVVGDGHAEAGIAGEDLVCAAASAILQAAELGLSAYAGLPGTTRRADGHLHIAIPEAARDRDDVRAILATADLAIAQLARQFPDNVTIAYVTARDPDESERELFENP